MGIGSYTVEWHGVPCVLLFRGVGGVEEFGRGEAGLLGVEGGGYRLYMHNMDVVVLDEVLCDQSGRNGPSPSRWQLRISVWWARWAYDEVGISSRAHDSVFILARQPQRTRARYMW